MDANDTAKTAARVVRQRRLVTALGILLVLAGIVILSALSRLPMPLRMMAGLGDIFVGCVLLVMVRQASVPPKG